MGRKQRQRVNADDDRRLERTATLLRHLEEHVGVPGQKQHAETVGRMQLAAVNRDVLGSSARIAGDHQAGADVRAAVVLVVGGKRQQPREVHITMHDLMHRRRGRLPPRDRMQCSVAKAREHLARFHAHRVSHPGAVGNEAGHDGNRVSARMRKQRSPHSIEPLGNGRQLETQADTRRENHEPLARREMVEPITQRADWLRSIVAICAWSLTATRVLERIADLGHTHLDASGCAQMYHCRDRRPTHAAPRLAPACRDRRGG